MPTFDFVGLPTIDVPSVRRSGIVLVQLHSELWRVTRANGQVLGYVERQADVAGSRFAAKRMFSSQRPAVPLGEFWSMDDAVSCFRFS